MAPFTKQQLRAEAAKIPVVLLAGGFGTRLSEETGLLPKPMVEIGGLPVLVHLMDSYARFGFTRFVICGGYKVEVIKRYFSTLPMAGRHLEVDFATGTSATHAADARQETRSRANWKVTVLETGLNAMTGARVRKALTYLAKEGPERVAVTYGDGLSNADLLDELAFHKQHGRIGTVLGVHQPTRFGILEHDDAGLITSFAEKPQLLNEYINGGFFLFERRLLDYLPPEEDLVFERAPLEALVKARELCVFRHGGFWQCMDTKRDLTQLEAVYARGNPPWLEIP